MNNSELHVLKFTKFVAVSLVVQLPSLASIHMKKVTKLSLQTTLPLTCTRIGTCCHGNQVLLNPFELFSIAKEKQITPRQFRDLYIQKYWQ